MRIPKSQTKAHHHPAAPLVASLSSTYMSCITAYTIVPATVTKGKYSIIYNIV